MMVSMRPRRTVVTTDFNLQSKVWNGAIPVQSGDTYILCAGP